MIHILILAFSFVLFVVAGAAPTHPQAPRLCYFGLALLSLSFLIGALPK